MRHADFVSKVGVRALLKSKPRNSEPLFNSIQFNNFYFMRVALNSRRLINLWPSESIYNIVQTITIKLDKKLYYILKWSKCSCSFKILFHIYYNYALFPQNQPTDWFQLVPKLVIDPSYVYKSCPCVLEQTVFREKIRVNVFCNSAPVKLILVAWDCDRIFC